MIHHTDLDDEQQIAVQKEAEKVGLTVDEYINRLVRLFVKGVCEVTRFASKSGPKKRG